MELYQSPRIARGTPPPVAAAHAWGGSPSGRAGLGRAPGARLQTLSQRRDLPWIDGPLRGLRGGTMQQPYYPLTSSPP
jgi:hypothetical protein